MQHQTKSNSTPAPDTPMPATPEMSNSGKREPEDEDDEDKPASKKRRTGASSSSVSQMKLDPAVDSVPSLNGEYVDSKGKKFAIVHQPASETERNELWSHLTDRLTNLRYAISEKAFGSAFSTEELQLLSLGAAQSLIPHLVSTQQDLCLRTPTDATLNIKAKDILNFLRKVSRSVDVQIDRLVEKGAGQKIAEELHDDRYNEAVPKHQYW